MDIYQRKYATTTKQNQIQREKDTWGYLANWTNSKKVAKTFYLKWPPHEKNHQQTKGKTCPSQKQEIDIKN